MSRDLRVLVVTAFASISVLAFASGDSSSLSGWDIEVYGPNQARPVKAVFMNGMFNGTDYSVNESAFALNNVLEEQGINVPVVPLNNPPPSIAVDVVKSVSLWTNQAADVTSPPDSATAVAQVLLSNQLSDAARAAIDKTKGYIAENLDANKPLVMVTHSQANFIVAQAISELQSENQANLNMLGVVGLAVPNATAVPSGVPYAYVTVSDDRVIANVPGSLPPNFIVDPSVATPERDLVTNHAVVETYLSDQVTSISGVTTAEATAGAIAKVAAAVTASSVKDLSAPSLQLYGNKRDATVAKASLLVKSGDLTAARGPLFGARKAFDEKASSVDGRGVFLDAPSTAVNPIYSPGPKIPIATGDGGVAGAYAFVNSVRNSVGVQSLSRSDAVERAASAHSKYAQANGYAHTKLPAGAYHREVEGMVGFTGVDPGARFAAAGLSGATGYVEAIAWARSSLAGAQLLVDAPFHRVLLLNSSMSFVGIGASSDSDGLVTLIIDAATTKVQQLGTSPPPVVVYPYPGQVSVPSSWIVSETPSPLPGRDGQSVGYPITFQNEGESFSIAEVMVRTQTGRVVRGRLIDDYPLSRVPLGNKVLWIADLPLERGVRHSVTAIGSYSAGPFVLSWSFDIAP